MEGNKAYLYLRSDFPVIVEKGAEFPNDGFGITHKDIPFSDDMRWANVEPDRIGTVRELIDYLETDELISELAGK